MYLSTALRSRAIRCFKIETSDSRIASVGDEMTREYQSRVEEEEESTRKAWREMKARTNLRVRSRTKCKSGPFHPKIKIGSNLSKFVAKKSDQMRSRTKKKSEQRSKHTAAGIPTWSSSQSILAPSSQQHPTRYDSRTLSFGPNSSFYASKSANACNLCFTKGSTNPYERLGRRLYIELVSVIHRAATMEILNTGECFPLNPSEPIFTIVIYKQNEQIYIGRFDGRCGSKTDIPTEELKDIVKLDKTEFQPQYLSKFTQAQPTNQHFIKRPNPLSYYPISDANKTRIMNEVSQEVQVCEILRLQSHPNIAEYIGCEVQTGKVSGICFNKYEYSLQQRLNPGHLNKREFARSVRLDAKWCSSIIEGIKKGLNISMLLASFITT
jgi:hypothetical protein